MAKARTPAMHWGILVVQRTPSLKAWARACFEQGALASTPLFAWDCARIYPARGSNVPKHRHPHQRTTTSYLPRIWRSESTYGVCPSNITIARLDADGFSVGGNRTKTTPVGNK